MDPVEQLITAVERFNELLADMRAAMQTCADRLNDLECRHAELVKHLASTERIGTKFYRKLVEHIEAEESDDDADYWKHS